jgi:type IV secretory pathway VirB6-like protein
MDTLNDSSASLESLAHIIQVALTPVFLLAGLATLLSVFSTRLGRVADKVDRLSEAIGTAEREHAVRLSKQLTYLVNRSVVLDTAVVLGALGGCATCASVLVLLVGFLWSTSVARPLFVLFGTAVSLTFGALIAFVIEMLMAGRSLRTQAKLSRDVRAAGDKIGRR